MVTIGCRYELPLRAAPEMGVFMHTLSTTKSKLSPQRSPGVVTIDYARQKLGKRGEQMSDVQIASLLSALRSLCSRTIDMVAERTTVSQNALHEA